MIPWFLISLVLWALNITSAVILLNERHSGPWLMLTGSGIALVGQIGSRLLIFTLRTNNFKTDWFAAMGALSSLGALLFSIGLLLHALHQRGKANRIAELEMILNSRDKQ
jgi:hypothetical protein